MLFEGFPERCDTLTSMRSNLMERVSSVRWATAWEENAMPLIDKVGIINRFLQLVLPLFLQ